MANVGGLRSTFESTSSKLSLSVSLPSHYSLSSCYVIRRCVMSAAETALLGNQRLDNQLRPSIADGRRNVAV
jgi:hypothetical protein